MLNSLLNDVDIQLILEFKKCFENIIQSFLKILRGFLGTPCICIEDTQYVLILKILMR